VIEILDRLECIEPLLLRVEAGPATGDSSPDLVATLFRLGLNVAATRLVLRDGYAGEVIGAFGHFVVGGSLVIGLVIFLILVVIQFVVITNGAGRVAEVGARFTLDAMPGKQMAIDADLNSGLIDEDTARRRRADVGSEADPRREVQPEAGDESEFEVHRTRRLS